MKKIGLFIFFLPWGFNMLAQSILNAKYIENYKKEALKDPDVMDYFPVEEKEISFYKTIWEEIDLREKINQIYYYRSDEISNSCESLYNVLVEGVKNNRIKAYQDDNFKMIFDGDTFDKRLEKIELSNVGKEIFNQGKTPSMEHYDHYKIKNLDVKKIRIKGLWYFNRRIGEMRYRILGIAPLGPDIYQLGEQVAMEDQKEIEEVELFWVWYAQARELLDSAKTCSMYDHLKPSFEELLSARKFSSLFYKENTPYYDKEEKLNRPSMDLVRKNQMIKEGLEEKTQRLWAP